MGQSSFAGLSGILTLIGLHGGRAGQLKAAVCEQNSGFGDMVEAEG